MGRIRGTVGRVLLLLVCGIALVSADFYKLLGVKKDAKDRELKKDKSDACKKDQKSAACKVANKNFMKLSRAYETLSDPEKRRFYDQTGFESKEAQQEHFNKMNRQGRGGGGRPHQGRRGGPFGGGRGPFGGHNQQQEAPPPPESPGPLPVITSASFSKFIRDSELSKRPVVLVFATKGHHLLNTVAKFVKKEEFKDKVRFAHVVVGSGQEKQLMAKYRIKKVPCVLMSSKAEPGNLRQFDGKLEERYLEKSVELALRSNVKAQPKAAPKQPKGVELVSQLTKDAGPDGFFDACLQHQGMCVIALLQSKAPPPRPQGHKGGAQGGRGRGASFANHPEVKALQGVAERVEKAKANKKLTLRWFWLDQDAFAEFARGLHGQVCVDGGGETCGGALPRLVAILPKKMKFAALYGDIGDAKSSPADAFITSVAGGDATLHKMPKAACLQCSPSAA